MNNKGSLSWCTCFVTRPRFLWSQSGGPPHLVHDKHGILRTYSNPNPYRRILGTCSRFQVHKMYIIIRIIESTVMIILQGYFFSFKKNDTNGKYHTAFHTTGLTQFFTIFMPVFSILNSLSTTGSRKK